MTTFSAGVYQNEYLPRPARKLTPIVTVTATTDTGQASSAPAAAGARGTTESTEIIVIDTSGSMNLPAGQAAAAKHAPPPPSDCIRDGVCSGSSPAPHLAHYIYPGTSGLLQATDEHRPRRRPRSGNWRPGRHRPSGHGSRSPTNFSPPVPTASTTPSC